VDWSGFELHPETPPGGMELARLHPGEGRDMSGYLDRFAAGFGVYGLQHLKMMPNTRRALAMAEFARDQGKLDDFRSRVMDARWRYGRDIGDDAVLGELAAAAGLDADAARHAADDAAYLGRLAAIRKEFKRLGVGGIPTFAFPRESIEGCRPYAELSAAALRSGARPRTGSV